MDGTKKIPLTPENIGSTIESLKLSSDEVTRLTKAFQDDEFKRLFAEYAQEVSDPANRAESEEYLRQLEQEGKAEEVYGAGTQLMAPEPAFIIKTRKTGGAEGDKFFINVCTSNKVDPASSTKMDGGENWSLPFSLSAIHMESDKSGKVCDAVDFCVCDKTMHDAERMPRLRSLLVETALEEAEKRFGVKLDRKVSFPSGKYFGAGKPRVQALRAEGGLPPGARVRPAEPPPVPPQQARGAEAASARGSSFSFAKPAAKAAGKAAAPQPPPSTTFAYEIVHQSQVDVSDTWKDVRGTAGSRRPSGLLVRVQLPGVASVADVSLDVSRRCMVVAAGGRELTLSLPFDVDDEQSKAKFDKKKQALEVRLPVIQAAPQPAPAVIVPAEAAAEEAAEEEARAGEGACDSPAAGPPTPPSEGEAPPAGGAPSAEESAAAAAEEADSENTRLWQTIHQAAEARPSVERGAAPEAASLCAAHDGKEEEAPPPPILLQAATTTRLPPRLRAGEGIDLE